MFLFKMHSIGSVHPVPRASSHWWNNIQGPQLQGPQLQGPQIQGPQLQEPQLQEPDEDVVVIQEEEMVLVRNEPQEQGEQRETIQEEEAAPIQDALVQDEAPIQDALVQDEAPQPKCTEPESTTSAPKPKKKQNKRK
jgi:hypothetical protein